MLTLLLALSTILAADRPPVPGATNPAITQATISQTICKPGWSTKRIRPPSSYTNTLKKRQMAALGYTVPNPLPLKGGRPDVSQCVERSANPACYEEDHVISLELGGAPRDPRNLFPEPWWTTWNAHVKDRLENRLHRLVCAQQLTLAQAQRAIREDWIAAYRRYVGPPP